MALEWLPLFVPYCALLAMGREACSTEDGLDGTTLLPGRC